MGTGGLPVLCLRKEGKSSCCRCARDNPLGVTTFEIGQVEYSMEARRAADDPDDGIAETQMPGRKGPGMRRTREILEATRELPLEAATQAIVAAVR